MKNDAPAAHLRAAATVPPVGDLAETIKSQQRRLADRLMLANAKGMPRMDYDISFTSALETCSSLDTAGQKDLVINDPK